MLRIAHEGHKAGSFCWKLVQGNRLRKGNEGGSERQRWQSVQRPPSHLCSAGDSFRF